MRKTFISAIAAMVILPAAHAADLPAGADCSGGYSFIEASALTMSCGGDLRLGGGLVLRSDSRIDIVAGGSLSLSDVTFVAPRIALDGGSVSVTGKTGFFSGDPSALPTATITASGVTENAFEKFNIPTVVHPVYGAAIIRPLTGASPTHFHAIISDYNITIDTPQLIELSLPVPEPGVVSMFALGLFVLLFAGRRRV